MRRGEFPDTINAVILVLSPSIALKTISEIALGGFSIVMLATVSQSLELKIGLAGKL